MITDAELRSAAAKAAQKINDSLPAPSECNHKYSKKFENKMHKILFQLEHPIRKHILQTAACFLLILSLGFGSVMVVSAEAREAVIEWIRCAYETVYVYFTEGSPTSSRGYDEKYIVKWVPDGYTLITQQDAGNGNIYLFQNEKKEDLCFQYMNASDGGSLMIEKGTGITQQIEFNNHSADIYIAGDSDEYNIITWKIDDVLFCISGNLSEDELVQMAKSVESDNIR